MEAWLWHDDIDLARIWELWAEAAAVAGQSIFQRPELAQEWLYAFGGDVRPHIGYSPERGAIVPWVRRDRQWTMLGAGLFDYCDAIGAASENLPVFSGAAFPGLREDSNWAAAWRRQAPEWGAAVHRVPRLTAQVGVAALDGRHPSAAERLRRAGRNGFWGGVHEPAARATLLEWLLRQKESRMRALGRANVLGAAEAHWLRRMVVRHPELAELWRGEVEGGLAAGFLTWAAPPVRYGYLLAFAPEFARYSPAILLLYYVLRESQREGLEFDFLTGDQPFKLRFADAQRRLYHLRVPAATD